LSRCFSMYPLASKLGILALDRNSFIGSTVFGLLFCSHDVSESESLSADRIAGRVDGQSTLAGAYPLGAWGEARLANSSESSIGATLRASIAEAAYKSVWIDRTCEGLWYVQLASDVKAEAVRKELYFITG
jgi:hypothetical protein